MSTAIDVISGFCASTCRVNGTQEADEIEDVPIIDNQRTFSSAGWAITVVNYCCTDTVNLTGKLPADARPRMSQYGSRFAILRRSRTLQSPSAPRKICKRYETRSYVTASLLVHEHARKKTLRRNVPDARLH